MFRGVDFLGTKVGSPAYVAPEVLASGTYTPACDVWALGVIMYILLVGFPPFYGDNDSQIFSMIMSGTVQYPMPFWGPVSADARDLVARMLTFDHAQRITASGILRHPFIVEHQGVSELTFVRDGLSRLRARRRFQVRWLSGYRTMAVSFLTSMCLLGLLQAAGLATVLGARMQKHATLRSLLNSGRCTLFCAFVRESSSSSFLSTFPVSVSELRALQASFYKMSSGNSYITRQQFDKVHVRRARCCCVSDLLSLISGFNLEGHDHTRVWRPATAAHVRSV